MRFMMEAAESTATGPAAALKLQGLSLAWARVFAVWIDDAPPDFSKTMAALDRELTRARERCSSRSGPGWSGSTGAAGARWPKRVCGRRQRPVTTFVAPRL